MNIAVFRLYCGGFSKRQGRPFVSPSNEESAGRLVNRARLASCVFYLLLSVCSLFFTAVFHSIHVLYAKGAQAILVNYSVSYH